MPTAIARRAERYKYAKKRPECRGSVDHSGLFEFPRYGVEEPDEHPYGEGERKGEVGDD